MVRCKRQSTGRLAQYLASPLCQINIGFLQVYNRALAHTCSGLNGHVCYAGCPYRGAVQVKPNKCLVIGWAFICLLLSACAGAAELHGKVVAIADGDTITVLDAQHQQHKIRLSGIDAPEKAQAFGQASKQHLSDLVFGREVLVTWAKLDRYGRKVGKVWLGQADVCLVQVRMGMAWHYKRYQSEQPSADQALYEAAESAARQAQVGLWADASPVAPWAFRHPSRGQPRDVPSTISFLNEVQPVMQARWAALPKFPAVG